ncbi:MAG TPA: alkaline phosphatase family protein [Candidatus Limnocylindrales bacterium]|nr:alkaline phosphatase family protein [Candidatus Limnocylindrales bacterium]
MVCKKPTPYSLLVTGTSLIALLLGSAFPDTALAAHDHHGANAGSKTPRKARSSVKHIVVVMMENRSFDHLLGWMPNADGNQNLAYPAEDGSMISTMPLAPDWQGCTHPDPDHSFDGARVEYDDGKMDGFLVAGANDEYAIGYYNEADRPFFNTFAQTFTTLDHFFAAHLGSTYPNRIFQHAAQTDRIENTLDISTLPTIWDRLAEAGISNRYYFSDVPFLLLWGAKYAPIFATHEQFLVDAAAGKLPAVSFVEPRFLDEESGTSGDDHPHADIRTGDAFLAEAFSAVVHGPDWSNTVFIVTYDEWGGFFDHVAPPRVVAPNDVDPDVVDGKVLLGMRVPAVVASPFTRSAAGNPRVDSTVFDHTSVLKLIEWRWNLAPLTARDASSDVGNLLTVLDFAHPDASVPSLPSPPAPPPSICESPIPTDDLPLSAILELLPLLGGQQAP